MPTHMIKVNCVPFPAQRVAYSTAGCGVSIAREIGMKAYRVAFGLVFLAGAGMAHAGDFSIGATASSLGVGGEVGYAISERFRVRAAGYGFSYGYNGTRGDVDYRADLRLASGGVYLDWHPFAGGFRVSLGGLADGNNLKATGQPQNGQYTINGVTFSAAEVGNLTGKADLNSTAPYLGLGWVFGAGSKGGFGVSVDAGVLYQGSPKVTLTSTGGTQSGNPILQSNLDAEARKFEDDIRFLRFYPALSLGILYRF